jgi:hypothetical protein
MAAADALSVLVDLGAVSACASLGTTVHSDADRLVVDLGAR